MTTGIILASAASMFVAGAVFAAGDANEIADFAVEPRTYRVEWVTSINATGYDPFEACAKVYRPKYLPQIGGDPMQYGQDFLYQPGHEVVVLPLATSSSAFDVDLSSIRTFAAAKETLQVAHKGAEGFSESGGDSGERYIAWTVTPADHFNYTDLHVEMLVTCYNTKLNERKAAAVGRPAEWPSDTTAWLRSQRYIESADPAVTNWLASLTRNRAEDIKPYALAKVVVQGIAKTLRQKEDDETRDIEWSRAQADRFERDIESADGLLEIQQRDHLTTGLRVHGARRLAATGAGSSHDAVCLFVAAMRAGDVPARPVIGFDVENERDLVSWAEFYLPEFGWIPVDVGRFATAPGMAHDINRSWPGFGSHPDLNDRVPLAFRFAPADHVTSGGEYPLIWGANFDLNPKTVSQVRLRARSDERSRPRR